MEKHRQFKAAQKVPTVVDKIYCILLINQEMRIMHWESIYKVTSASTYLPFNGQMSYIRCVTTNFLPKDQPTALHDPPFRTAPAASLPQGSEETKMDLVFGHATQELLLVESRFAVEMQSIFACFFR